MNQSPLELIAANRFSLSRFKITANRINVIRKRMEINNKTVGKEMVLHAGSGYSTCDALANLMRLALSGN